MSDRDPDCLFCKIVAGEIPSERVDEDERTVAFMDINPATRGHALVIPRRHAANLLEIDAEDLAATHQPRPSGWRGRPPSASAPTASTCSTRAARPPGRRSFTSTST